MGLLDLLRKRPSTTVRVTFRDIDEPPPRVYGSGYIYAWKLREAPQEGMRVLVPGMDGPAWAFVIGVDDATREELRLELQDVIRPATPKEVAQGQERHEREHNAWLDMMRRAAGLPTRGRARRKVPQGYPEIPPAEGSASPATARQYGSAWWRAHKEARDEEEAERFKTLARGWYAVGKQGG